MVGFRSVLTTLAIGTAIISSPAAAQPAPARLSLTHVVSVTIPPRVKVGVARIAPSSSAAVKLSSSKTPAEGLALSVNATQPWVLSIAKNDGAPSSRVQWSLDQSKGFSAVTAGDTPVASGNTATQSASANVFFHSTQSTVESGRGQNAAAVVLTMATP